MTSVKVYQQPIEPTEEQIARLKQFTERDSINCTMVYGYQSNFGGAIHRLDVLDIVRDNVNPIKPFLGGRKLTSPLRMTFNAQEKFFSDKGFIDRGGNHGYNGPLSDGEQQYTEGGLLAALDYFEPKLSEFVQLLTELGVWTLGELTDDYEEPDVDVDEQVYNDDEVVAEPIAAQDTIVINNPIVISEPDPEPEPENAPMLRQIIRWIESKLTAWRILK